MDKIAKPFPFFLLLLLVTRVAFAQTITLELGAEKDNSMFSENSGESNGAGNNIFAGKIQHSSNLRRGLIKFDVSSIPANAIIQSVKLELYVFKAAGNTTVAHNFDIHKVTSDWGEGGSSGTGSGSPAQTNDATWSQRYYPSTNWSVPGGDFEATVSASDLVAFSTVTFLKGEWSSAQMVSDVNFWRANSSLNFGWIIIGDETINGSAKAFASKEMAAPYQSARPKLIIQYSIPSDYKIVINEVNPIKKWVELYNPDTAAIDISNYTLVNGMSMSMISGGNISVLNGNLLLDSAAYVVLRWPNISASNGELALFDADTVSGSFIDFFQYGAANQSLAAKAVTVGIWDNDANFPVGISDSTKSYSLSTSQTFINGESSNSSHWNTQFETPTYLNNPCPAEIVLNGNMLEANYYSSNTVDITGNVGSTLGILIDAANSVFLSPGLLIEEGAVFSIEIGGCLP